MHTLAAWLTSAAAAVVAPQACQQLTQALDDITGPRGYLGAVAWVAQDGATVLSVTSGKRELARREPMVPDAIFRLYSMSKPITSAAVMLLMQDGRLALDDPITRWLPEFAAVRVWAGGSVDAPLLRAPARPITVRHLLSHQAGFAVGDDAPREARALLARAAPDQAGDLAGYARRVAQAPLAADPGTRFAYDGVATEVLARIIEVASGLPLERFFADRLFTPLGMRDTGFEVPPAQRQRIADLSTVAADGRLVLAATRSAQQPGVRLNAYASGAGGLYSTAADFARFCTALADGGAGLRYETLALMFQNQLVHLPAATIPGRPDEGFGLGGAIGLNAARIDEAGSRGMFGWTGAASTYFSLDVAQRRCAILLLQHLHGDAATELPKVWPRLRPLLFAAARASSKEAPCRR